MYTNRYIEPLCTYGFKTFFGNESNKLILIDFLNALLDGKEARIVDLNYIKNSQQENDFISVANVIVHCISSNDECFMIELMNDQHNYFLKRVNVYTSLFLNNKAVAENHNLCLCCNQATSKAFYLIDIINCSFRNEYDNAQSEGYLYEMKIDSLKKNNHALFEKLNFIHLSTFKFNKSLEQLEDRLDRWLYLIKNLPQLKQSEDELLKNKLFPDYNEVLFENIAIKNFTKEQTQYYFSSLDRYLELKSCAE